uniref:Putative F-box protein n=1 Tax=Noccaea caerulescens TaxID=107243 RepID=A0A1J3FCX1_NOCCA
MSFDVRSEKFSMIELPSNTSRDRVMTYDGKLACVDRNYNARRFWILEDAENHKWSSHNSLSLPLDHYNKNLYTHFNLTGFTHACR